MMIVRVWFIRHYRWCISCGERAATPCSDLCVMCQAEMELDLANLLEEEQSDG